MPDHKNVKGVRDIELKLKSLATRDATKLLRRGLLTGANVLRDEARSRAPKRFSYLRKRIASQTDRSRDRKTLSAKVTIRKARPYKRRVDGQTVFINPRRYAHLQEFGTKHHPPHPFMRPAFDAKAQEAATAAAKRIRDDVMAEVRLVSRKGR